MSPGASIVVGEVSGSPDTTASRHGGNGFDASLQCNNIRESTAIKPLFFDFAMVSIQVTRSVFRGLDAILRNLVAQAITTDRLSRWQGYRVSVPRGRHSVVIIAEFSAAQLLSTTTAAGNCQRLEQTRTCSGARQPWDAPPLKSCESSA